MTSEKRQTLDFPLRDREMNQEQEANAFATALLMPLGLVKEELTKVEALAAQKHWGVEEVVYEMAQRFQVSEARMAMRLKDLEASL